MNHRPGLIFYLNVFQKRRKKKLVTIFFIPINPPLKKVEAFIEMNENETNNETLRESISE